MTRPRHVLVLGGTGFVGRHLVPQLAADGVRVTVVARRREYARHLILLPTVQVVEADPLDTATLARLVPGATDVVNLVGIINETARETFAEVHVEGARKVAEACARGGARLVHMSAINADPAGPSRYLRSKGEAEALVAAAGAPFTIFRPSVIFGREDRFLNLFARLLALFPVLPLGSPNARFKPVYVVDVATAFAESLKRLESFGRTYDLVGTKVYTLRELVRYVGELTGHRRPILPLGDGLSGLQASIIGLLPGKLLTRDNYLSMKVDSVSQQAFPFGIAPTPLEAVAPVWLANRTPRARYQMFRDRSHENRAV